MPRLRSIPLSIAVVAVLAACSRKTLPSEEAGNGTAVSPAVPTGTRQSDSTAIAQLEAEAKTLAKIDGCSSSSDCRTAAAGSRGCGGPRYYLPYCAKTTDSVALLTKLDAVAAAEKTFNIKYQIVSTCEMRLPPLVEVSGGSCIAR